MPILFSLRPSSVKIGDEVCSLSASMVASIQATVAGMGKETCSYSSVQHHCMSMKSWACNTNACILGDSVVTMIQSAVAMGNESWQARTT